MSVMRHDINILSGIDRSMTNIKLTELECDLYNYLKK
jgi:hypothetical protein